MNYKKIFLQNLKIIILFVLFSVGVGHALSWNPPSSNPPGGNISAPLNIGNINQIKGGGTSTTGALLHINGLFSSTKVQVTSLAGNGDKTVCVKNSGELYVCGGTTSIVPPTVTTANPSSVGQTTAIGGGTTSSDGGATVTVSGLVWDTSSNPTTALSTKTTNGWATGGPWTSNMTGLSPGTTYHVRAYATNSAGTAYGNDIPFTSLNNVPVITPPTLTTSIPSSVGQTTAVGGGTISSNGGAAVTVSGLVWSTSPNPTTALSTKTTNGWATGGPWTSNMTGLTQNTIYYVRAYATNSAGTAYGNEVSFTTLAPFYIGQSYQGGIIFYINPSGQGGLIGSLNDQTRNAGWGCYGKSVNGATGTAIGTGRQNTVDIMRGCSTRPIAASIAANVSDGGYTDWYLPSKDELIELYNKRSLFGPSLSEYGFYWSSTEGSNDPMHAVWVHSVAPGGMSETSKGNWFKVRAIRSFGNMNVPSVGSLDSSPSSCVIPKNASTCSVTGATWATLEATNPSLIDVNTGSILSSLNINNVTPLQVFAAYPNTVLSLKDGGSVLANKTITTSCAYDNTTNTNTVWYRNKCTLTNGLVVNKEGAAGNGSVTFTSSAGTSNVCSANTGWAIGACSFSGLAGDVTLTAAPNGAFLGWGTQATGNHTGRPNPCFGQTSSTCVFNITDIGNVEVNPEYK